MAVAVVQSVFNGTTNSTTLAVTISATGAGSLLVLTLGFGNTAPTVSGVTDSHGDTFVQASSAQSNQSGRQSDIWYFPNCAAGITTVTVTFTSAQSHITAAAYEISGAATSSVFDSGNSLSVGSGNPLGPTITPAAAGEILIACLYTDSELLTGANSPWTLGGYDPGVVNGFASAYYINAPLSSQQCVFTPAATCIFGSSVAAFKAPAATTAKWSTELVF